MKFRVGLATVVSGALALSGAILPGVAGGTPEPLHAAPPRPDSGSAEDPGPVEKAEPVPAPHAAIVGVQPVNERLMRVFVDSPAMHRTVQVLVLLPADRSTPRPTVYMLDGRSTQPDSNNWLDRGNAAQFYADKQVNVVFTVGGPASFYTDWQRPDPVLGVNKWETFLTQELPAYLESRGVSRTNNGVLGLSMGGSAALTLAAYHRDQFKFAGSLSGYLNISAPGMREAIRVAMVSAGSFNVDAMWGPPWNPAWLRNDPFVFAPELAGLSLYISAASGLPGQFDQPRRPVDFVNTGSAIGLEALALMNSRAFQLRMNSLGIPATYSFPANGTHSWPYWGAELWKARGQILDTLNAW